MMSIIEKPKTPNDLDELVKLHNLNKGDDAITWEYHRIKGRFSLHVGEIGPWFTGSIDEVCAYVQGRIDLESGV